MKIQVRQVRHLSSARTGGASALYTNACTTIRRPTNPESVRRKGKKRVGSANSGGHQVLPTSFHPRTRGKEASPMLAWKGLVCGRCCCSAAFPPTTIAFQAFQACPMDCPRFAAFPGTTTTPSCCELDVKGSKVGKSRKNKWTKERNRIKRGGEDPARARVGGKVGGTVELSMRGGDLYTVLPERFYTKVSACPFSYLTHNRSRSEASQLNKRDPGSWRPIMHQIRKRTCHPLGFAQSFAPADRECHRDVLVL